MNFIFCNLKNLEKHEFQFLQALKTSKSMNLCRPKNILHLENLFDNVLLPQATTQQMIFCPQKVWSKKKKLLLILEKKKKILLFFFDRTFQPQINFLAILLFCVDFKNMSHLMT